MSALEPDAHRCEDCLDGAIGAQAGLTLTASPEPKRHCSGRIIDEGCSKTEGRDRTPAAPN